MSSKTSAKKPAPAKAAAPTPSRTSNSKKTKRDEEEEEVTAQPVKKGKAAPQTTSSKKASSTPATSKSKPQQQSHKGPRTRSNSKLREMQDEGEEEEQQQVTASQVSENGDTSAQADEVAMEDEATGDSKLETVAEENDAGEEGAEEPAEPAEPAEDAEQQPEEQNQDGEIEEEVAPKKSKAPPTKTTTPAKASVASKPPAAKQQSTTQAKPSGKPAPPARPVKKPATQVEVNEEEEAAAAAAAAAAESAKQQTSTTSDVASGPGNGQLITIPSWRDMSLMKIFKPEGWDAFFSVEFKYWRNQFGNTKFVCSAKEFPIKGGLNKYSPCIHAPKGEFKGVMFGTPLLRVQGFTGLLGIEDALSNDRDKKKIFNGSRGAPKEDKMSEWTTTINFDLGVPKFCDPDNIGTLNWPNGTLACKFNKEGVAMVWGLDVMYQRWATLMYNLHHQFHSDPKKLPEKPGEWELFKEYDSAAASVDAESPNYEKEVKAAVIKRFTAHLFTKTVFTYKQTVLDLQGALMTVPKYREWKESLYKEPPEVVKIRKDKKLKEEVKRKKIEIIMKRIQPHPTDVAYEEAMLLLEIYPLALGVTAEAHLYIKFDEKEYKKELKDKEENEKKPPEKRTAKKYKHILSDAAYNFQKTDEKGKVTYPLREIYEGKDPRFDGRYVHQILPFTRPSPNSKTPKPEPMQQIQLHEGSSAGLSLLLHLNSNERPKVNIQDVFLTFAAPAPVQNDKSKYTKGLTVLDNNPKLKALWAAAAAENELAMDESASASTSAETETFVTTEVGDSGDGAATATETAASSAQAADEYTATSTTGEDEAEAAASAMED